MSPTTIETAIEAGAPASARLSSQDPVSAAPATRDGASEDAERLARLVRIWPCLSPDLRLSILHFAIDLVAIERVMTCEAAREACRTESGIAET